MLAFENNPGQVWNRGSRQAWLDAWKRDDICCRAEIPAELTEEALQGWLEKTASYVDGELAGKRWPSFFDFRNRK